MLLDGHRARLARSAAEFDFAHDDAAFCAALARAVGARQKSGLRVRAVLWRDGRFETSTAPLVPVARFTFWRVAMAARRLHTAMPKLLHKTTRRAFYEDELAHAAKLCNADEVIFRNERQELCEGARCNLFLRRDGVLLTPPLACGLLPGVLRASLLASGEAREAVLLQDDLANGELFMGNSVRGLVAAQLIVTPEN